MHEDIDKKITKPTFNSQIQTFSILQENQAMIRSHLM